MYGPNGEDVASLLDSLADIDDATAEAIADAYEAIPKPSARSPRPSCGGATAAAA
jgi:hypothetical protein